MFVAHNTVLDVTFGPFEDAVDAIDWMNTFRQLFDGDSAYRPRLAWTVEEVVFTEDPHDKAEHIARFTFGPGKLEAIQLRVWRDGVVKVDGDFIVYCGNGTDHAFHVDSGFVPEDAWQRYMDDAQSTHPQLRDADLRYDAVSAVVDEVVGEEWTDPCESTDDDEDEEPNDYLDRIEHGEFVGNYPPNEA